MIRVRPMGQLGNQMFQYVIGKILAEKTGQMYVPGDWLNKAEKPLKWNMTPYLRPVATSGERLGVGSININVQHWFDLNNIHPGWEVDAVGFFQRYELIAPYRDKIRNEWLKIQCPFVPTDDDAVYIHVRRTDYLGDDLSPERNCQATTMDEFLTCLFRFPNVRRAVIVSDDYNDQWLGNLASALMGIGITVGFARGTWDEDWLLLSSCRNLIMSQSTYSWWAAYLGRATKIVCPVFPNSLWGNGYQLIGPAKGNDYPNLEVTGDSGKEWIWLHE